MAITKSIEVPKIEVVNTWSIQVATDISGEDASVQAMANAVWTDTVKANYKTFRENQGQ